MCNVALHETDIHPSCQNLIFYRKLFLREVKQKGKILFKSLSKDTSTRQRSFFWFWLNSSAISVCDSPPAYLFRTMSARFLCNPKLFSIGYDRVIASIDFNFIRRVFLFKICKWHVQRLFSTQSRFHIFFNISFTGSIRSFFVLDASPPLPTQFESIPNEKIGYQRRRFPKVFSLLFVLFFRLSACFINHGKLYGSQEIFCSSLYFLWALIRVTT